ncbi:hypothetical protein IWT140_00029 [Secundilactobacillus pentosiphilus]|uniref:Uncharacterized protein n=1 Tax=Secundilactobacillus pentosiphilus TaxID=1714682 RepID=A0A1Z5IKY8_9LACO|nr:hypothetical protein [Secundilactobacillus pentosiphilus]GAX02434.1 hypothetical protein IWT140_00029 [Secundilactobacillus pentosiphilus]
MKKSVLVTIALSASLFAGLGAASVQADASAWHKGTPSFLVGHKYRTSIKHGYHGMPTYQYLTSTKNSIDYIYSQADGYGGSHTGYKRSDHVYTVRYRAIDWYGTHKYHTYKISRLSATRIKVGKTHLVKFSKYPTWHGKTVR